MDTRYIIIRKRDDNPLEVWPFEEDDIKLAEEMFERLSANWTECYLTKVIKPIRPWMKSV